ncbi:MAG: 2-oxoglutarate dehydrogenase complex dihydrolipoyllysine-residue succinyltransferase [Cryomorphaceae bacterium]|nr:MAG: 2-oxoglutarate dehydrogenase complex dihydrolipoyllysine-residue succinyltransferase [Cryomorphaceae bacterium]
MILEMKVPSPGESISEVEIATWLVQDGDYVEKDQAIAEVDSDKATLELPAEDSGVITLKAEEGDTVAVGAVVCLIDTSAEKPAGEAKKEEAPAAKKEEKEEKAPAKEEKKESASAAASKTAAPAKEQSASGHATGHPSPAARKLMDENKVRSDQVNGTGKDGRITKQDVLAAMAGGFSAEHATGWGGTRDSKREKMSMLRRKISERLVSVKNDTAMLTTFNEVNMQPVMDVRNRYKDIFKEQHGVGLGFMSFFTKAVTEALRQFPAVNAQLDGQEIVYHDYADIGIAVSSPKGLMVPVLRNAEQMSLADIEAGIKDLAVKARDGKISIEEMTGGTFTITNGGVFGSMLSTPIINPPQSAILGMHNIVERPIAENGQVVIRPVMYVALSYDHRIIDGKESVSFLVAVKEMLENPTRLIFGGKSPEEVLLGL